MIPAPRLRGSEASTLVACLDALPYVALLVDDEHRVVCANRAARDELGPELTRLRRVRCAAGERAPGEGGAGCPLAEAGRTGRAVERELYDERQGRWRAVAVYPTSLRTAAGRGVFLHLARDVTGAKQAALALARDGEIRGLLDELLRLALTDAPLEELLGRVLQRLFTVPWLTVESRGAVFLVEGTPPALVLKAQRGLPASLQELCRQVPFGQCLCGRAAASRAIQFADHLEERHEHRYAGIAEHGHYCVPVCSQGRVLGVLNLYLRAGHARDESQERFLAAVADVLAGIIERRRAEYAHALLAAAVEQAAEAVVVCDPAGVIQYANPALERMSGYPRGQVLGRPLAVIAGGAAEPAQRELAAALAGGTVWSQRVVDRRADGASYHHDVTVAPVRDPAGAVTYLVAVLRDLTQEVQLEAQLRQAQKMEAMGQLAAGVAHDFNNVLFVIQGYVTLLQNALPPGDARRASVAGIAAAASRAAASTRQLLAFGRQEEAHPELLDLDALVADTVKVLGPALGPGIEIATALAPTGPVRCDRRLLEQVLVNLVVNARDAMPGGGKLTITTGEGERGGASACGCPDAPGGRHVTLAVSDTGCGMTPEVRERIFEPFFTTKEAGKGTGLGLSTVFGIVRQAGGCVRVVSAPGAGSTFTVCLPGAERGEREGAPPPG